MAGNLVEINGEINVFLIDVIHFDSIKITINHVQI